MNDSIHLFSSLGPFKMQLSPPPSHWWRLLCVCVCSHSIGWLTDGVYRCSQLTSEFLQHFVEQSDTHRDLWDFGVMICCFLFFFSFFLSLGDKWFHLPKTYLTFLHFWRRLIGQLSLVSILSAITAKLPSHVFSLVTSYSCNNNNIPTNCTCTLLRTYTLYFILCIYHIIITYDARCWLYSVALLVWHVQWQ